MSDFRRSLILGQALATYGIHAQEDMAIEEMSELTKALLKRRRGEDNADDILGEIADVQIMLDQMRMIYGHTDDYEQAKIERLAGRLGME